jgi:hypothetical protein
MLDSATGCRSAVELKPRKSHDFAIVAVGAQSARQLPPVTPAHTMNWTPTATRADVIRMVARYVKLQFSVRSTSGELVIDEGRLSRKRKADINVEQASVPEILDAIHTAEIRRAVYATPDVPVHRTAGGVAMRRVAPRRDVASIVQSRPTRSASPDALDARNWRATVGSKLAQIAAAERDALVTAAEIRIDLMKTRNQLEAARSAYGRLRGGGRQSREMRHGVERRIAELRSAETAESARLKHLVRSAEYRHGIDHLLTICTKSRDIEAYCFGE